MTGAVVVVSYGSSALLEADLVPLGRAAPDLRVVVVDNFSGHAERRRVSDLARREGWHLVTPDGNPGFGAGADAGVAAAADAGCDAVVLLNPDARATPEVVGQLLDQVRADPTVLLSPVVVNGDGSPWFRDGVLDLRGGRTSTRGGLARASGPGATARWLSGACLALATASWAERGGFDHRFFLYWEDVELSLRWQAGGGRVLVRDDLVVAHDVGGTQGAPTAGKSALYVRHNCRGRLLLGGLLGPRTFATWVLLAPRYGWEVVRRGGRRRLLRHPSLLLAAVRGTAEGLLAGARVVLPGRRGRSVTALG